MPRFKTTLRLLLACAICGALLWALDRQGVRLSPARDRNARLVRRHFGEIDRVVMTAGDGVRREFRRSADGWEIVAPFSAPASEAAIQQLVDAFEAAPLLEFIGDGELAVRELTRADFGLANPDGTLEVYGPRTSVKIAVGRSTATTNEAFAAVDSLAGVCVTVPSLARCLARPIEDFADRRLCRANLRDVETVLVERPGESPLRILRTRDRRGWRMGSQDGIPADWGEMLAFFDHLRAAQFSSIFPRPPADGEPEFVIKLFGGGSPFPSAISVFGEIPDRPGFLRARSDGGADVAIAEGAVRPLDITGNDIRDRRVFLSGPTLNVTAFTISLADGAPVTLDRSSGRDWALLSPVRAAADQGRAAQIVGGLLGLYATAYIPAAEIAGASPAGAPAPFPGPALTLCTPTATNRLACTFIPHVSGSTNVAVVVDAADFAALLPAADFGPILQAAAAPATLVSRIVSAAPPGAVASLSLSRPGRPPETVVAAAGGAWAAAAPATNLVTSSAAAAALVATQIVARAVVSYAPPAPDADPYGLAKPQLTATFGFLPGGPERLTLVFGAYAPDGGAVYAAVQGEDIVYEIPNEVFDRLDRNLLEPVGRDGFQPPF